MTDGRAEKAAFDGMDLSALVRALWGHVPTDLRVSKLRGQASLRRYYRVETALRSPARAVVMRLPDSGPGAFVPGETFTFSDVQRHLRALALPVPEIYVDQAPTGLLAIEDLGDDSFEARLLRTPRDAWKSLYFSAISLLAALHERTADKLTEVPPPCVAYTRSFDRTLLTWELDHFREWGLDALGFTLSEAARGTFDTQRAWLVDTLLALPPGFAHRDFQSRNLMWSRPDHLVLIDFQDALLGPFVYDLVALLCDSYVDIDGALQDACIARYAELRGHDYTQVKRAFDLCAVQRKLKDAGRFVFIDRVRGNPGFLPAFGPSLVYVDRALAGVPELAPLRMVLADTFDGYPGQVAPPPALAR